MSAMTGLAAVLAAVQGKQPATDTIAKADHTAAIEAAVTQGFTEGSAAGKLEGEAAGKTAGKAEGAKEGAAAERARIKSIMTHEKAKGRATLAQSLALNTELTADQAIAVLAEAPVGSRLDGLVPQPKTDALDNAPEPAAVAASWERSLKKAGAKLS